MQRLIRLIALFYSKRARREDIFVILINPLIVLVSLQDFDIVL